MWFSGLSLVSTSDTKAQNLGARVAAAEATLADPVEALILDLIDWIGPQSRAYSEVMDAWRTSCPRLPVWEDANERGFIERHLEDGLEMISVTPVGREFLAKHRPLR